MEKVIDEAFDALFEDEEKSKKEKKNKKHGSTPLTTMF